MVRGYYVVFWLAKGYQGCWYCYLDLSRAQLQWSLAIVHNAGKQAGNQIVLKLAQHNVVNKSHRVLNHTPPTHIVVDEIQVVSGSDGHGPAPSLGEPGVGLMECLMDIDKGVDDGLSVSRGLRDLREHSWEQVRTHILKYTQ